VFNTQRLPTEVCEAESCTVTYTNLIICSDDEHARALEEQWVDNVDAGVEPSDAGGYSYS
jgi:predicted dinucleotide-binding enzyme